MTIGSRITEWRKARGLTQAKLAEQSKLSASAIAMYETNRRSPDQFALSKLAEALQIPPALLTGGDNHIPLAATASPAEERFVDKVDKPASRGATRNDAAETVAAGAMEAAEGSLSTALQPVQPPLKSTTQLALTHEEARIILFLRMNPASMSFFESYIRSDAKQRHQLSRTWRLIHDFQKSPS